MTGQANLAEITMVTRIIRIRVSLRLRVTRIIRIRFRVTRITGISVRVTPSRIKARGKAGPDFGAEFRPHVGPLGSDLYYSDCLNSDSDHYQAESDSDESAQGRRSSPVRVMVGLNPCPRQALFGLCGSLNSRLGRAYFTHPQGRVALRRPGP